MVAPKGPGHTVRSEYLRGGGVPSRDKIREQISGNYCRCTGYQAIVDAIESVLVQQRTAQAQGAIA